jgi:hypothetical protein
MTPTFNHPPDDIVQLIRTCNLQHDQLSAIDLALAGVITESPNWQQANRLERIRMLIDRSEMLSYISTASDGDPLPNDI